MNKGFTLIEHERSKSVGRNEGFTLIELLVVIGIIAILTVITLPHFRLGEDQFALQRSGHMLAQDLRRVKEMAMSAQEFPGAPATFIGAYGIRFQKGSSNYILFADLNNNGFYETTEMLGVSTLEEGVTVQMLFPATPDNFLTIVFSPPDPSVAIHPPAISGVITIGAPGLASIAIQVNRIGLINIE